MTVLVFDKEVQVHPTYKSYCSPSPKCVTIPWGNNWLAHTNYIFQGNYPEVIQIEVAKLLCRIQGVSKEGSFLSLVPSETPKRSIEMEISPKQGCATCCSLAAGLPGNGERMRKWRGNGKNMRKLRGNWERRRKWTDNEEMDREWGNGQRMRKWRESRGN